METPRTELVALAMIETVLECRIGRINALEDETGARLLDGIGAVLRATAGHVTGILVDAREAPPVLGPNAVSALGRALSLVQSAEVPVVVLISPDPLQRLQMTRLLQERAPQTGRLVESQAAALEVFEASRGAVGATARTQSQVRAKTPEERGPAPAMSSSPRDPWSVATEPGTVAAAHRLRDRR